VKNFFFVYSDDNALIIKNMRQSKKAGHFKNVLPAAQKKGLLPWFMQAVITVYMSRRLRAGTFKE